MDDNILTVADVATLLKVAEKTIYTMAQNSEIPCFKIRGQWRFRGVDLHNWISNLTSMPAPVASESGKSN